LLPARGAVHSFSAGNQHQQNEKGERIAGRDVRISAKPSSWPRVMIRAHVGGVAKEDLRSFPLRKGFDPRVFLVERLLDQGRVALLL
jgi:hypothetical protein